MKEGISISGISLLSGDMTMHKWASWNLFKYGHARAFTDMGVTINHTPLSLNQWILFALYFYLIFSFYCCLLQCFDMFCFSLRTAIASQWGLYLVTKPTFLLQLPGCKGFWSTARQAVFAFLRLVAQLAHMLRSRRSFLKSAAAPPC